MLLIFEWLDISTTIQCSLFEHFLQFGGLDSFSNKSRVISRLSVSDYYQSSVSEDESSWKVVEWRKFIT